MRHSLFTLGIVFFCAQAAQAAETQMLEETSFEQPALIDNATLAEMPEQNFVINVSWQNYMDTNVTTNLNDVEPAAGNVGNGSFEDGFTVSLTDQVVTSPTPPKFELAYTTRKNFTLRTKHSGLMFYKKYKFEPSTIRDTMPHAGNDIEKPTFSE